MISAGVSQFTKIANVATVAYRCRMQYMYVTFMPICGTHVARVRPSTDAICTVFAEIKCLGFPCAYFSISALWWCRPARIDGTGTHRAQEYTLYSVHCTHGMSMSDIVRHGGRRDELPSATHNEYTNLLS